MKSRRQIALIPVGVFKAAYVCPSCCHEATGYVLLRICISYLMINLGLVQLDTMFARGDEAAKFCTETPI